MDSVLAEGATPPLFPLTFYTDTADIEVLDAAEHIQAALKRGLPEVRVQRQTPAKCVIVGGGRSVLNHLPAICEAYESGARVIAVNKVHDWLLDNGIVPSQIVFEIGPIMGELDLKTDPRVVYYVCSLCHPSTFDALAGRNVQVWHAAVPDDRVMSFVPKTAHSIGGGSTTFGRSIPLGLVLGHRSFEIFGAESSFEGETHYFGTPDHCRESLDIWVKVNGEVNRRFTTARYLAKQAHDMRRFFLMHHGMFRCRFHGDGLLPYVHKTLFPEQY